MKSRSDPTFFFFFKPSAIPLPFRLTNYNSNAHLKGKKHRNLCNQASSPFSPGHILLRKCSSPGVSLLRAWGHAQSSLHFFTGLGGWGVKMGSLQLAHSPSPPQGRLRFWYTCFHHVRDTKCKIKSNAYKCRASQQRAGQRPSLMYPLR